MIHQPEVIYFITCVAVNEILIFMLCFVQLESNQKHPKCKMEWPRTKTDLAEKDAKSNGRPRPPGFNRFENFGHYDLTAKHCYFRYSRPPDVDGIKIFDKDDQATKH